MALSYASLYFSLLRLHFIYDVVRVFSNIFIRHRNEDCKRNKFSKLTRFCLVVFEQHSVHVDQENHAAKVQIEVESLIERRRYVRGYYFRHGKGDPHHNQKFPVQRAQSGRQGVAAAETEIEAR